MMNTTQEQSQTVKEVTVFCILHQGRCFKDWPASKIFRFIAFHYLMETLFIHREGSEIAGVGIGWLAKASELRRRNERGIPQFAWGLPDKGNALFISDVFGERAICVKLWEQALRKWPMVKQVFAYRLKGGKPKLVEFKRKTLNRFYGTT